VSNLQRREGNETSERENTMSDKSNDTLVESNNTLVCDECGAENWNLASLGKSHDQPANPIKGYEACAGVWRLPDRRPAGVVIQFPLKRTESDLWIVRRK
jgi:hypothetical protein